MSKKKNRTLPIVLTIFFCILYLILAVRPSETELNLMQDWSEDINRTAQSADEGDILIPFKLGQTMGYFTQDGRITASSSFPFKASISNTYFSSYSTGNTQTVFYDAKTVSPHTIDAAGYPYFEEDRIFNFLPGGTAVSEYSADGTKLWQYESYAPITAFSSSKGGRVIGFADGSIASFTSDGKLSQTLTPGGSEEQAVLGVAVSEDGNTVAAITGQNRQRFIVSQKQGELSRIIYHDYIDDYSPTQRLVKFSKKNSAVFYDSKKGLGLVDLKTAKSTVIPIEGTVLQIEESESSDFAFVLSKNDGTYTVTILEDQMYIASSFSFDASSAFIQVLDDALFVGRNDKISKITVTRQ